MRSTITTYILMAAVIITAFQGCRKGDNDPFFSLKSRKARLTGTWELTNLEAQELIEFSNQSGELSYLVTKIFDGATLFVDNGADVEQHQYYYRLEIKKDGTYEVLEKMDDVTTERRGNWWWIDSDKKKKRIALDDDFGSFEIDELRDKKLVLTKSNYELTEAERSTDFQQSGNVARWEFKNTKEETK